MRKVALYVGVVCIFLAQACADDEPMCTETLWYADVDGDGLGNPDESRLSCVQPAGYVANADDTDDTSVGNFPAVNNLFGGRIDLTNLANYANQSVPDYIDQDNTTDNPITDAGATLGRVLFYDTQLSLDNTISCGSCHQQAFAFSDPNVVSDGVLGGTTGRHSMRLINARFAESEKFFWDIRAGTLEEQTTMPVQDHAEMGFSGMDGRPGLTELIERLEDIDYYRELFTFVYGDATVTEDRLQRALAQFIRSIQSFDSRFDEGRAQVSDNIRTFPNFTAEENLGKRLFLNPPNGGPGGIEGAGCQACHRAPEFDIDPLSHNNGVITTVDGGIDRLNTRAPSLRDLVQADGTSNGPFMHDGSMVDLMSIIEHYNAIPESAVGPVLDPRLRPNGDVQRLELTDAEKAALVAFLRTLAGTDVYTNEKWSDPF